MQHRKHRTYGSEQEYSQWHCYGGLLGDGRVVLQDQRASISSDARPLTNPQILPNDVTAAAQAESAAEHARLTMPADAPRVTVETQLTWQSSLGHGGPVRTWNEGSWAYAAVTFTVPCAPLFLM